MVENILLTFFVFCHRITVSKTHPQGKKLYILITWYVWNFWYEISAKKLFDQCCMHSFPRSRTSPISQKLGNYTEKNILYPVNHNLHPKHTLQIFCTDCVSYLLGMKNNSLQPFQYFVSEGVSLKKTASGMHVPPQFVINYCPLVPIVVHCCPLFLIVAYCCNP